MVIFATNLTRALRRQPVRILAVLFAGFLLASCTSAPHAVEKPVSHSLTYPLSSALARSITALSHAHPNQSGHVVLDTGRQAFNSRVALAGTAERTLDAQYYIWNNDTTGRILANSLVEAADRGVRVRLLMDDYGVGGKDRQLIALDAHARIEVRVYNPFNEGLRTGLRKWMHFAFGFARLNHRMHSKTFITDNSFAITGGRNIGDEYFDANPAMNHRDRDMLSVGPVVDEISSQFDLLWNSEWAIPITSLTRVAYSTEELSQRYQELREAIETDSGHLYPLPATPAQKRDLIQSYLDKAIWAPTRFVYNPPSITGGDESGSAVVSDALVDLLSKAENEVLVESAYFTIMNDMISHLSPSIKSGLDIKVLTNSLSTTDVWTIHAGYTRNREKLLQRGVEIYEWRRDGQSCTKLIDNDRLDCDKLKYSLHAKSVVFDRDTVFVGSFNLNPRSQLLNTETALIIHSTELAQRIAADISLEMQPENSWRLGFDNSGALRWYGTTYGVQEVFDHEPKTSFISRFKTAAAAIIPLEKYW